MNLSDSNETKTVAGTLMERQVAPMALMRSTADKLHAQKRHRHARVGQALWQSLKSALQAIRMNKLRSLLTSLGIIIGVGAVIMVVSISESEAASINQSLSDLNPNELVIRSGSADSGGVRKRLGSLQLLKQSDADAISAQVPHVTAVSPIISADGRVIFQSQNWPTWIQGVYPSFQLLGGWQIQQGSLFTNADLQNSGAVAVIGQTVVDKLFTTQGINPVGQQIRIGNVPFTVIGVLTPKGATDPSFDQDDIVYVPFTTAQQRLKGSKFVDSINVLVDDQSNLDDTQAAIQQLLEQLHNISNSANDDFTIEQNRQILETAQAVTRSLATLLVSIAAISLLVGGIGIMNIMLVSVTERTREIGIRMAVGARPGDAMIQFLIEALVLSALGGLVGIALGTTGAFIVSLVNGSIFALSPMAVLLAFGFSAAVGIIFGFYPAQRAARLDPIVALHTL